MMTFDQVREGLGLMPFDEYLNCPKRLAWINEMQSRYPDENISFRASGTTTKMLCEALAHLSTLAKGDKIYIKGHNHTYSRVLCETARDYAHKLGLDPMAIQPFYREVSRSDGLRRAIFTDHFYRLGV